MPRIFEDFTTAEARLLVRVLAKAAEQYHAEVLRVSGYRSERARDALILDRVVRRLRLALGDTVQP